jgi:hypothetical protein
MSQVYSCRYFNEFQQHSINRWICFGSRGVDLCGNLLNIGVTFVGNLNRLASAPRYAGFAGSVEVTIGASRTPPWLASERECRDRHLSRA